MSFYIPSTEIAVINQALCDRFDALHEITQEKSEALIDACAQVGGESFSEVAFHFFVLVMNGSFFSHYNKATAFGALHSLMHVNSHHLEFSENVPMDILFPPIWNDKSAMNLHDFFISNIKKNYGDKS